MAFQTVYTDALHRNGDVACKEDEETYSIIMAPVKFRKPVRGNEWHCTIRAEPDLLHPEPEGDFEAQAYQGNADLANKKHLRPGDRLLMQGTLQHQTIELENGEITSINHFFVTSLEV